MNKLDEDLDDSSLFCKSLIQKHKNLNSQQPKQVKLTFYKSSSKTKQSNDYKQENNLLGYRAKSTESNDWILNESKSSYFHTKVLTNSCPLCLKSFNSDSAYSAHMKQCAKTHQMTTQQLLKALELQKKQMQERRDLGLCSQIVPLLKKNTAKKNLKNEKESYDLALGLALSKSLITCEKKGASSQEVQKTTLEEFGFKSSTTTASRKKNENKSLLKNQTMEERQKIIVEKVAVVLLDEDEEDKNLKKVKLKQNSSFQNYQVPHLWNLGENGENCEWYVSEIKPLIFLEEEITKESPKLIPSDSIKNEISKLSLPRKEIFNDWKKLINNDFKSDWVGKTKDDQNIYLHSLVLFARCPEISEKDCESIFKKFNLSTIIIFLEYLYCGTLNGLIRTEINNLFDLVVQLKFNELINILNHLKSDLLGSCNGILKASWELRNIENNEITHHINIKENKKPNTIKKDLFPTEIVDLTQSSPKQAYEVDDDSSEKKSYWSFIQHQKENALINTEIKMAETSENQMKKRMPFSYDYREKKEEEEEEKEKNLLNTTDSNKLNQSHRKLSDDSETRDLFDEIHSRGAEKGNSDCMIISSGSESNTKEYSFKLQSDRSHTPSSVGMEYEIPNFNFYDDFHGFSEEQLSPVGLHSQSLLAGNISAESLISSNPAQRVRHSGDSFQKELKETVGYCSTPVSIRHISKIKSSEKNSTVRSNKRKRSNLSANRILRKSLGLQHRIRNSKLSSSKKNIIKRGRSGCSTKKFAKALTNSILNELSRSSVFNSSPLGAKKCVEITPINYGEEFGESVTPSPNYSNMGGSMLKQQLTKYGLKKNLAKSKAKKILNYIYEELHPFYNMETKKIVKALHTISPKAKNKSKFKASSGKNVKIAQNKNSKEFKASKEKSKSIKKTKDHLNVSKESKVLFDTTILSLDGPINHDSEGSEFDDLNETLTQSVASNPDDLPSVFCAFIRNNPEYHQKILLYEPIWLEELQKKLKETFKKHFKLTDIMNFLDQKCVTFRSVAQTKRLQRRKEKKENLNKKKKPLKRHERQV